MTITTAIRIQLFEETETRQVQVIRIKQGRCARRSHTSNAAASQVGERFTTGTWTTEEHELFLEGLSLNPSGPWKLIARHVGTRTPRQAMTHAQKYRMRIERRARREATSVSPSVPALVSTSEIAELCDAIENESACNVAGPQPTDGLTVDISMPVIEVEMAASAGEIQSDLPSGHSQLACMVHGDEAAFIDVSLLDVVSPPAFLDCDFDAMVMAHPMFYMYDMELFVSDHALEPLQILE